MIQFASVAMRDGIYFVDWRSILGGGEVTVPCSDFDAAVAYARNLPDVTISIDCEVPQSVTAETFAFLQEAA